jgi:predicted O-methyltransferase YrrM
MLSRIVKSLLKPHQIPSKLLRRVKQLWIDLTYDLEHYEAEQTQFFGALGLDYLESKKTLSEIYDKNPNLIGDTNSCHHNLFAALSKSRPEFKKILEIGTHSGTGAALLSILFPHALVETIDLPDDLPGFESSYGHDETFIKKRNNLLSSRPNVIFNQIDSASLTFASASTYDFIWVDGDHEYPLVAVDITNCLRLLNDGGLVACDDVRKKNSPTFETIQKFVHTKLIKSHLIHKRTFKPRAHQIGKFVAVLSRVEKKDA